MSNNWVIWIIFGLLIAALIGFLVFTFIKDKRKNKKIIQKRSELRRATIKSSKELAIKIYTLIELNEEYVKQVIPGVSKVKMKNVTSFARNFLKDIYDSKTFKAIYLESDEADPEYAKNIKKLIDQNSNLWNKYCQDQITYFKKLHDSLKEDVSFQDYKNDANKLINDYFEQELKKVEKNESTK